MPYFWRISNSIFKRLTPSCLVLVASYGRCPTVMIDLLYIHGVPGTPSRRRTLLRVTLSECIGLTILQRRWSICRFIVKMCVSILLTWASSHFWNVRQRRVLLTDVSGQSVGFMFLDSSWTAWHLKMEPIGCPETPVTPLCAAWHTRRAKI
jgi:hypothetical protein